jgi:hypothetical protein
MAHVAGCHSTSCIWRASCHSGTLFYFMLGNQLTFHVCCSRGLCLHLQYENLYCVVRGKKVFHLLPPTELYRMSLQLYPAARYEPQVGPAVTSGTCSDISTIVVTLLLALCGRHRARVMRCPVRWANNLPPCMSHPLTQHLSRPDSFANGIMRPALRCAVPGCCSFAIGCWAATACAATASKQCHVEPHHPRAT